MNNDNETLADIEYELRNGAPISGLLIPDDGPTRAVLPCVADRLAAAAKREAAGIVQIIQDAIIGYADSFPHAPNDEARDILRRRVKVANDWLDAHGFLRIDVVLDEEDPPCL